MYSNFFFSTILRFWPLPWLWPPLLSWLSEPHVLYDRLPLPLAVKRGTTAAPHAVVASHSIALRVFQRRFKKC